MLIDQTLPVTHDQKLSLDQPQAHNSNQPTPIEVTTSRIMQDLLNGNCENGYNGKWAHLVFSRSA